MKTVGSRTQGSVCQTEDHRVVLSSDRTANRRQFILQFYMYHEEKRKHQGQNKTVRKNNVSTA